MTLLALSVGTPAGAQTPAETTTCIEFGEIAHRWIPSDERPGYGNVSLQIQVTNTCDQPEPIGVYVEMLDSDGFLVEATRHALTTVRPGPATLRIKHTIMKSRAAGSRATT